MNDGHSTLRSYIVGFIFSIYLTLTAYLLVVDQALSKGRLIALVAGLAVAQFAVQVLFFLHLGREAKPRWKLVVFGFMVMIVAIFVLGSLWIMSNLNSHMSPADVTNYLHNQDGF